jgi:hypothetical protein
MPDETRPDTPLEDSLRGCLPPGTSGPTDVSVHAKGHLVDHGADPVSRSRTARRTHEVGAAAHKDTGDLGEHECRFPEGVSHPDGDRLLEAPVPEG